MRESEKLKTVLELYDLETHQKKKGPDYHRLETMVKRSIEQDIRNKNLAPEVEFMKETLWSRIQGQNSVYKEFLEIVGNGSPTGSVLEDTIAVSVIISINVEKWHSRIRPKSFMHQSERNASRSRKSRGKSRWWHVLMALQGLLQRNLHQNACRTRPRAVADLGKSARMHIVRLMNNLVKGPKEWWQKCSSFVEEEWFARKRMATCCQPGRKSREIGETRYQARYLSWFGTSTYWTSIIQRTAIGLCTARHEAAEVYLTEELRHAETNPTCEIHTKIRDQNPPLGYSCPGEPHQRSPNAPQFEDLSQEETAWCPRSSVEAGQKCVKMKGAWTCKDNTSSDPFSRWKCAIICVQMKLTITEYSLTTSAQLDYKMQKERTLHLVLRLRGETEVRHQLSTQRTWTSTLELMHAWSLVLRLSGSCRYDLYTTSWLKFDLCASSHVHKWSEPFSSILGSPFQPTSSSPHSCSISCTSSTTLRAVVTLRTSPERRWTLLTNPTDESYLLTGEESKNYDLMGTEVESFTESLTHPQFSEPRFLEDVDYDDTALEEMLRNAHRVHVDHSQREGLSVGQSSSSVSERAERPVEERSERLAKVSGQELNVGNARIRTLLDRQKEQILAECQVEI